MKTQLLGAMGEAAAADWLRKKRWKILAMNYRCRLGEVDIIARDGREYVFVEVKLRRTGGYAPAAEYVTPAKQRKLRLAAESWLVENELEDPPCRFDVVEIYLDRESDRIERLNLISEAF
jgi:putative endonuclease